MPGHLPIARSALGPLALGHSSSYGPYGYYPVGMAKRQRTNNHARRWLVMNSSAEFLFPVEGPTEIDVIRRFCADHSLPPGRVWVHPLGADFDALRVIMDIAPAAARAGFNVSTRLNVGPR